MKFIEGYDPSRNLYRINGKEREARANTINYLDYHIVAFVDIEFDLGP